MGIYTWKKKCIELHNWCKNSSYFIWLNSFCAYNILILQELYSICFLLIELHLALHFFQLDWIVLGCSKTVGWLKLKHSELIASFLFILSWHDKHCPLGISNASELYTEQNYFPLLLRAWNSNTSNRLW